MSSLISGPLGIALAPWNVLASGKFRTDAEEQHREDSGEGGRTKLVPDWHRTEEERRVSSALEAVAKEIGAKSITAGKTAVMILTPLRLIFHTVQLLLPGSYKKLPISSPLLAGARSNI